MEYFSETDSNEESSSSVFKRINRKKRRGSNRKSHVRQRQMVPMETIDIVPREQQEETTTPSPGDNPIGSGGSSQETIPADGVQSPPVGVSFAPEEDGSRTPPPPVPVDTVVAIHGTDAPSVRIRHPVPNQADPFEYYIEQGTQIESEYEDDDNGWDESIERRIQELNEQAQGYGWMHNTVAQSLATSLTILEYIVMIIPALITLLQSIKLVYGTTEEINRVFEVIILVLGFATILAGNVLKNRKLSEKIAEHNRSSLHWYRFANKLATQLADPRANRKNGIRFKKSIEETNETLKEKTPLIKHHFIQLYKKFLETLNADKDEDQEITAPPEAGGVKKAPINKSRKKVRVSSDEDAGADAITPKKVHPNRSQGLSSIKIE
jgi:Ca2+/Na+ antiporter